MLNLADDAHDNEWSARASRLAHLVHRALRAGVMRKKVTI
jgi:hypothetical protein